MTQIIYVTDSDFDAVLTAQKDKVVLIDFYAEWCGPCKMMDPILKALVDSNPDVVVLKTDIDKAPRITGLHQIRGVPTMYLHKNGVDLDVKSGAMPLASLKAWIASKAS